MDNTLVRRCRRQTTEWARPDAGNHTHRASCEKTGGRAHIRPLPAACANDIMHRMRSLQRGCAISCASLRMRCRQLDPTCRRFRGVLARPRPRFVSESCPRAPAGRGTQQTLREATPSVLSHCAMSTDPAAAAAAAGVAALGLENGGAGAAPAADSSHGRGSAVAGAAVLPQSSPGAAGGAGRAEGVLQSMCEHDTGGGS
jgi:hypothetical protein